MTIWVMRFHDYSSHEVSWWLMESWGPTTIGTMGPHDYSSHEVPWLFESWGHMTLRVMKSHDYSSHEVSWWLLKSWGHMMTIQVMRSHDDYSSHEVRPTKWMSTVAARDREGSLNQSAQSITACPKSGAVQQNVRLMEQDMSTWAWYSKE